MTALLFASGACSLVYQTVWLREFRLVFGASTGATAAVLALFMGGLGAGGLLLGGRADRHRRPLGLYGQLEALIALAAALSPLLLSAVAAAYLALRASMPAGAPGGTILRLLLAAPVVLLPTLLMGGTLPAAARSVPSARDAGRRRVALLYGANTLGAVFGTLVSTFFLLELLGNTWTLWSAAAVNAVVAAVALLVARPDPESKTARTLIGVRPLHSIAAPGAPPRFVLAAAAIVAFAFLLMELVWYRMLGPLLGGSTFTFGLILAVALAGLGIGGLAYLLLPAGRRPTLTGFSTTCALEALFIAAPLALGDRLAVLAWLIRPLGAVGLEGHAIGWLVVTAIVVLPPALVAGFQFPLLVGLLGEGRARLGSHVGLAYAWNTAGAIVGSVAGGFGLLASLSAPGTWRAVAALLVVLSAVSVVLATRPRELVRRAAFPTALSVVAIAALLASGPTAAWRHSGIGAGRAGTPGESPNALRGWINEQRRAVVWEADGVESSVALMGASGLAFHVNGKSDGHAIEDAGTQVMSGLVGAALHPNPRRAFVVGLGTGSTAGWLARVPSMERVDVVEFEPSVVEVARACSAVNAGALENPALELRIGDGREVLLTTRERYDLVVSEPSNPYRAGVASLFTREYYEAAGARLRDGGIFIQWFQAYEVEPRTVRTAYATIASVFPHVETWSTQPGDILFVASREPVDYDAAALRERLEMEPYRTAMAAAWRSTGLEGFLARFVARAELAREIAAEAGPVLNTDDRTVMEFEFGRCVGGCGGFGIRELERLASARGLHRPSIASGSVDWATVDDIRISATTAREGASGLPAHLSHEQVQRAEAHAAFAANELGRALELWRAVPREPVDLNELAMVAECLSAAGNTAAAGLAERLREHRPAEADAVLARLAWSAGRAEEAAVAIEAALAHCRTDPWPSRALVYRTLQIAVAVACADPEAPRAARLLRAMLEPLAVRNLDIERRLGALQAATCLDPNHSGAFAADVIEPLEPHVPWERDFLTLRYETYRQTGHPRAEVARRELEEFLAAEGETIMSAEEGEP